MRSISFPAPPDDHAAGDELPEGEDDDHAEDDDGGDADDAVEPVEVTVVEHLVELPRHQANLVRQKLLQAGNLQVIWFTYIQRGIELEYLYKLPKDNFKLLILTARKDMNRPTFADTKPGKSMLRRLRKRRKRSRSKE